MAKESGSDRKEIKEALESAHAETIKKKRGKFEEIGRTLAENPELLQEFESIVEDELTTESESRAHKEKLKEDPMMSALLGLSKLKLPMDPDKSN